MGDYGVVIVADQACQRRSMMGDLSAESRSLISSARSDEVSWTGLGEYNYFVFLWEGAISVNDAIIARYSEFIENMGSIETPNSLYAIYQAGVNAAQNNIVLINWGGLITIPKYYTSSPQIDGTNLAKEVYL